MNDKNENIYNKYGLEVVNYYKKRGLFYFETSDGVYVLKPYNYTEKKVEWENKVKEILLERGITNIDICKRGVNGEYICCNRYDNAFVLKKWFNGTECDITNVNDILRGSKNLALLHNAMEEVVVECECIIPNKNLVEEYEKYNNEIYRVKKYIQNKKRKNVLEIEILRCIDVFLEQANEYYNRLISSEYDSMYNSALRKHNLCHGSYTYRSIFMCNDEENSVATIDFDRMSYGVSIYDLFTYLQKTMEKTGWDLALGINIINEYEKYRELAICEKEVLIILLGYPEKFHRLINSYFNGKKMLVLSRHIEKINELLESETRRKNFIKMFEEDIL